jgi:hypothetical protein
MPWNRSVKCVRYIVKYIDVGWASCPELGRINISLSL